MSENGRRGIVWSYFDEIDSVNKEAECRLCHNVYKFKGTSYNLKLHLKHKHNEIFLSIPNSEVAELRKRANGTDVWACFEPVDIEKKLASCNACKKHFSYKTTTANLKCHLRIKHKELYAEMLGEQEGEEYLEDDDSDSQNDAWSFFERAASGQARCVVCRELVSRGGLRDHLRTQHPKLLETVDSEEEPTNTQDEVYTEVVYLENEDPKENVKRAPKSTEKIPRPRKSTKKRRLSSSSDEEPLKLKKDRQDDEIEQFGKYVTCLLKKVPQETCMELQMEIVNLILKKQLGSKRNESQVSKDIKMAAVEVQTDDCFVEDGTSFNNQENVGDDK